MLSFELLSDYDHLLPGGRISGSIYRRPVASELRMDVPEPEPVADDLEIDRPPCLPEISLESQFTSKQGGRDAAASEAGPDHVAILERPGDDDGGNAEAAGRTGDHASVDLIRLRLREARRNAQGKPPAPKPQRKDSATHRRQGQLAEAVNLVTALRDDLQGVLDGWGDSFAGSERYERFAVAVGELEGIAETLGDIDVSWG